LLYPEDKTPRCLQYLKIDALRCLLYPEDRGARLLQDVGKCQKDLNLDIRFRIVNIARNVHLT